VEPYLPPGERQELLKQVERCDAETQEARKGEGEKHHQQLLICLERGLHLRRQLFGEASTEVAKACRRLCEACNSAATQMLQKDSLSGVRDLLKRAEEVACKSDFDRAITWNNLACYYRRTGKLRTAVTFLQRALAIEEHMGNSDAAQTHLNLCATLSMCKRHKDALFHAQSALIRIYEVFSPLMLNGELSLNADGQVSKETREQVIVLCIAYHNLAVEHEHLNNIEQSLSAYATGFRWANRFLEAGHQLPAILKKSAEALKAKLDKHSAAARRSEELMAGFPQKGLAASATGSRQLDEMLTPRHHREDDEDSHDNEHEPEDSEADN